jgi:hypothetical protein
MATVNEAESARTALGAALKAGLDVLDLNQTLTFNLYQRHVLPIDGFVFWVKVTAPITGGPAQQLNVMGALHYVSDLQQGEDETQQSARVVFTAQQMVNDFKAIAPQYMYICDFDKIRFAFATRGQYFQQADLHHYIGQNLDSAFANMVIDDPAQLLTPDTQIVSNSLPLWMSLSGYAPAWPVPVPMPAIPLYPSLLAPLNHAPPFGTVDIDPDQSMAFQAVPLMTSMTDHYQLMRDRVVVHLYGCTNRMALDFLDAVLQYTLDTDNMGIVGTPPFVRDDKKNQTEMLIVGMKKRIVFEVSYYQSTVRNIARQLIEKTVVSYYVQGTQLPNPH